MRNRKHVNVLLVCLLCFAVLAGVALILASIVSASDFGREGSLFDLSDDTKTFFGAIAVFFLAVILMMIVYMYVRKALLKKKLFRLKEQGVAAVIANENNLRMQRAESKEGSLPRFYMLNEIDEAQTRKAMIYYDNEITLEQLCERFRAFASSKLKLYYSIEDIRKFIAGMACSHVLIMQGMSGTGKTSLAYAFGEFIKNSSAIVPIQPMWKERSDLLGYYNEFTKRFNETVLLQKMYEANYSEQMYVVVLDEMNIARVEYYFAEFLSLLEIPAKEGRYIDVVSDVWDNDPQLLKNGRLKLPSNIWFIGTANNDDSTFAISDKVYDRAMIMNLDKKAQAFEGEETDGVYLSAAHFERLCERAQKEYRLTGRNRRRLQMLDAYMIENFKITFGNRIMKQIEAYIPTYLACGGEELAALDDIIAKKVLRKLETQNPIYVRNNVEALCGYLDELFGYDSMILCKTYLSKFERSA